MGDFDSICGFAALGLDIFPVMDVEEAGKKLGELVNGQYGILYVTEQLLEQLETERVKYNDRMAPTIVPIPSSTGSTGYGRNNIRSCVKRAVGSDITLNGEK